MAEVVRNSAEETLKGLYSRNPATVEAARHQAERLTTAEFLRLLHLFESESSRTQMGKGTRAFVFLFFLCMSGASVFLMWDQHYWVMGLFMTAFWTALAVSCFFWRVRYTNEDSERVESSLRGVLKTTHSPALAQAAAVLFDKRQQQELANGASYGNTAITHAAYAMLLRVLPTLQTAEGWNPEGRQALFDLMHDDTYEHKLASHILDAVARWRDVDALPQLSKLTKREDRPLPLRRHANEVMTLLLAERQKRQVGEGLLRASAAPQGHSRQELLRPAAGHVETPPEQLLRPQA